MKWWISFTDFVNTSFMKIQKLEEKMVENAVWIDDAHT